MSVTGHTVRGAYSPNARFQRIRGKRISAYASVRLNPVLNMVCIRNGMGPKPNLPIGLSMDEAARLRDWLDAVLP